MMLVPRRPPLVFVDDLEAPRVHADDRHHLTRALRVRVGDEVTAADGKGEWRPTTLAADGRLEPRGPAVRVAATPERAVGLALLKGDRNELVVQKLTELGIDRIVLFHGARSVARWDPAKATRQQERLAAIAREAAMQCRRPRLPEVQVGVELSELLTTAPGPVALAEPGGPPPSAELRTILVGPEGGWSPEELAVAPATVDLGGYVLRAETAALAAGTVLGLLRSGHLGPRRT